MGGSSSKQNKNTGIVSPTASASLNNANADISPPVESPHQHEQASRPPVSTHTPLNIAVDVVRTPQSLMLDGLNRNLSKEMLITPGREESMYLKVAYTPKGEQATTYKYYCPLCMSFCMDIFKSKCCNNYTCGECCTDFLNKRDVKISTMNDLLNGAPYKDTACPHCNTMNFHPSLVTRSDTVRDYSFSSDPSKSHLSTENLRLHSPLKIGDSFEVMKIKMEKLHASPGTIIEISDSPQKTLFPDSARETPRGIAITPSASSSHSAAGSDVHRTALSFVNDVFSSQDYQFVSQNCNTESVCGRIGRNNVSEVAAAFVHNIFNPDSSRRLSRNKVTPLYFGSDSFDGINVDGSNSHRENSSRRLVGQ